MKTYGPRFTRDFKNSYLFHKMYDDRGRNDTYLGNHYVKMLNLYLCEENINYEEFSFSFNIRDRLVYRLATLTYNVVCHTVMSLDFLRICNQLYLYTVIFYFFIHLLSHNQFSELL